MYTLTLAPDAFAVCRLPAGADIPPWGMSALNGNGFATITRTREELSIVCAQASIPVAVSDGTANAADTDTAAPNSGLRVDTDWRAFHVKGPFAFTEVGVLAALTTALANANIGIFAISTFDTDHLLVKAPDVDRSIQALTAAGHTVEANDA